ncbi:MAG: polyprenyl synthetase family protein [Paracraurococcus sp.]|jgi:geranylgeranyl diphosphate synthase, type II
MDGVTRIERSLETAVARAEADDAPPRLAAALRHAVFPRGARVRPRLCLAVAAACGEDAPVLTDAAAAAIELLHCASLVHDDLPCFDDAAERRGRPSVHRAFGVPLALLAGDALIVLAFQTLAQGGDNAAARLPAVLAAVGQGVGVPHGIVAGQSWECEPIAALEAYHRQKTGALFAAAAAAGAASAGATELAPWRCFGERLGEAYQAADDIRDVVADPDELGKPAGRDAALGRPSLALALGIPAAVQRLEALVAEAAATIPACHGAAELRALVRSEARRLTPRSLSRSAA